MPTQNYESSTVKVWDPLIRVFHWSLVFFFLLAFASGDDWAVLHVQAGYGVAFLVGFRLLWGIVGSRHARFTNFVRSPEVIRAYFKSMLIFKVPHYQGHNPLAGAMIVLLLFSIFLVSLTGLIIIASGGQGPLAGTFFTSWPADAMEDIHEFLADFTLLLVIAHVSGVLLSSLLEGENLVKAMLTGRKKFRPYWHDVNPEKEQQNEN